MGKTLKIVVCGSSGCGKTSALDQLIYGNSPKSDGFPTIEDTYVAHIETERGVKEKVRFYEIGGAIDPRLSIHKHYCSSADAFVLMFDLSDPKSMQPLESIRKEIDRGKDRREITLFLLGSKSDLDHRGMTQEQIQKFVTKEKFNKYFEVSSHNRQSLIDAFVAITTKLTTPPSKSAFPFGKKEPKG